MDFRDRRMNFDGIIGFLVVNSNVLDVRSICCLAAGSRRTKTLAYSPRALAGHLDLTAFPRGLTTAVWNHLKKTGRIKFTGNLQLTSVSFRPQQHACITDPNCLTHQFEHLHLLRLIEDVLSTEFLSLLCNWERPMTSDLFIKVRLARDRLTWAGMYAKDVKNIAKITKDDVNLCFQSIPQEVQDGILQLCHNRAFWYLPDKYFSEFKFKRWELRWGVYETHVWAAVIQRTFR